MPRNATVIFITLLLATAVFADEFKGNADFTSSYESTGGMVNFPHGIHAKKLSKKCNFCHSALRTFGGISQMYGHKVCAVCHKNSKGPEKCNACHDKAKIKAKD